MVEQQVDESVLRADRRSKIIALLFAAGLFLTASWLTADPQFNMIVAAFAGIGLRIYIPYHASIRVSDPDHEPIQAYEGTGNYHQGAAGGALVVASLVALVAMVVELSSMPALAAGGAVGVITFLLLRKILPS
jgi:putative flippase GtrA